MKIATRIVWDMATMQVIEKDEFEYSGPLAFLGGGPSPEQKAAAVNEAALTKTATDTASKQNAREDDQYAQVKPFYTNRLQNGLPYINQLLDPMSGIISRAFAPAYQSLNQRFAVDGLPSGSKDAAIRDLDAQKARAYDTQMVGALQQNDAAKQDAASGLVGQQGLALSSAMGNTNAALSGNNSIMQAPLQSQGVGGILGGVLQGTGAALLNNKKIPF